MGSLVPEWVVFQLHYTKEEINFYTNARVNTQREKKMLQELNLHDIMKIVLFSTCTNAMCMLKNLYVDLLLIHLKLQTEPASKNVSPEEHIYKCQTLSC